MSGLLYGAWGLSIIADLGAVFATIFREWKRSSIPDTQNNLQGVYATEGLWIRCTSVGFGSIECDNYDTSILALPGKCIYMHALTF